VSGEKFEKISQDRSFSIINRLFIETVRLFLKFILGIENFLENRLDISLKFFISIGFFQFQPAHLYLAAGSSSSLWLTLGVQNTVSAGPNF
jgi:hypothetical protein